jgi:phosphatidylcholine synthase
MASGRALSGGMVIHLLTASGAGFALMAALAADHQAWAAMFGWLGAALVVDAIDGPLARRFAVAESLPRWSGATLDLVVDFVTYVFVPAYAIVVSGLLPGTLAVPAGLAIVVSGALYFADRQMKRADHAFSGFPAIWNVVAFYLLLLRPPVVVVAAIVAALCIATFVPIAFIHPLRTTFLRRMTLLMMAMWCVLALVTVTRDMSPGPWITGSLCAIAFYVAGVGIWLTATVRNRII